MREQILRCQRVDPLIPSLRRPPEQLVAEDAAVAVVHPDEHADVRKRVDRGEAVHELVAAKPRALAGECGAGLHESLCSVRADLLQRRLVAVA